MHYVFGVLFGFLGAWAWFSLINMIEPKHTYRSYITDRKQCKKIDGKFNCKMEVWAFPSDNPSGTGRKLSEDEIKRLTPNQWMNAMANQALGKPVESKHNHTIPSHKHSGSGVSGGGGQTSYSP